MVVLQSEIKRKHPLPVWQMDASFVPPEVVTLRAYSYSTQAALSPLLSFLYWHMHCPTEYHMYVSVPCYRLAKLHALIRDDLPPTLHGLYATWKQIAGILRQQRQNPTCQYVQELPLHADR
jgi:fatty acid desaturase